MGGRRGWGPGRRGGRLGVLAAGAFRFPIDAVLDFLAEDACALCRRPRRVRRDVDPGGPAAYLTEPVRVRCLWGAWSVVNHPVCARCAGDLVVAKSPGVLLGSPGVRSGAAEASTRRWDRPRRHGSGDNRGDDGGQGSDDAPRDGCLPNLGRSGEITVVSPFMTTDGALRIIHLLKFAGYSGLALPVGHAVAWALRRFAGTAGDIGIVVPTPMDRRSQRRRGFNHAERIAEVVSGELGVPLAADVLLKTVRTRRQSLTAREARAENVRRAFSCPAGAASLVSGRPVLLVDDLVTSGATAEACASALFDAEAASVTVACFGRAL